VTSTLKRGPLLLRTVTQRHGHCTHEAWLARRLRQSWKREVPREAPSLPSPQEAQSRASSDGRESPAASFRHAPSPRGVLPPRPVAPHNPSHCPQAPSLLTTFLFSSSPACLLPADLRIRRRARRIRPGGRAPKLSPLSRDAACCSCCALLLQSIRLQGLPLRAMEWCASA